jgi:hypothetical protein
MYFRTEILHHVFGRDLVTALRHRDQSQRDEEIVLGQVGAVLRGNLPNLWRYEIGDIRMFASVS